MHGLASISSWFNHLHSSTCLHVHICLAGGPRSLGKRGSLYLLHFIIFMVHTCTCAYVHAFTKQVYFHSFVKFQNFLTINGFQMYHVYYNCCVYGNHCSKIRREEGAWCKYAVLKYTWFLHRWHCAINSFSPPD